MLLTPMLLFVGVVGGHWAWTAYAERQLTRYVDGLRRAGEPITLADLQPAPLPDADNAAIDLSAAASALNLTDPSWRGYFAQGEAKLPMTPGEVEVIKGVLAVNHEALAHVRNAAKKSGIDWSGVVRESASGSVSPMSAVLQGQGVYRVDALAGLLFAAALVAHQEGDEPAALARVEELLLMSGAVARRPTLQAYSYSLSREAAARAALAHLLPDLRVGDGPGHVPPARVRALIDRLLDTRPYVDALRRNARAERARQIANFATRPDGGRPNRALGIADPWGAMPTSDCLAPTFKRFALRPVRLTGERDALDGLDASIAAIDVADPARFLDGFSAPVRHGGNGDDGLFIRTVTIALNDLARRHAAAASRRHATAVALACSLHRAERGDWPRAGLDELVPAYLAALPVDPVAPARGSFVYVPGAERPRVYSVWVDGVDHGGTCAGVLTHQMPHRPMADLVIDLVRQPLAPPVQTRADDYEEALEEQG
jgi:hypothetical protein